MNFEGGIIQLADRKIVLFGWKKGSQDVPEVQDTHIEEYMTKRGGRNGLKTGTSSVGSGHINEARIHNICLDIQYCFIMAECTPQEKLLDVPYTVLVCVHN